MGLIEKVPYSYPLIARRFPVMIVCFTPAVGAAAWCAMGSGWIAALAGLISFFGLGELLAQVGRDLGKRKEPELFKGWGGKPTNRYLSHLHSPLSPHTLERYHKRLRNLLSDLRIPTRSQEMADPAAAEQIYQSCTDYLRDRTRDKAAFPLVFAENVNYGFRRNLWGMKCIGIVLTITGVLGCIGRIAWDMRCHQAVQPLGFGGAGIGSLLLILWLFRFTPAWVKTAGDAYAERLFECLERIEPSVQAHSPIVTTG